MFRHSKSTFDQFYLSRPAKIPKKIWWFRDRSLKMKGAVRARWNATCINNALCNKTHVSIAIADAVHRYRVLFSWTGSGLFTNRREKPSYKDTPTIFRTHLPSEKLRNFLMSYVFNAIINWSTRTKISDVFFLILFPEQYLDGNSWLFLETCKKL